MQYLHNVQQFIGILMEKYNFLDDYSEGCHPNILEALSRTNFEQHMTYGLDSYCEQAKQLIHAKLNHADSQLFFVTGGTQANLIVTAACLRSHEAVISASVGHILNREAGAIEATGHKIISMETSSGKLDPEVVQRAVDSHKAVPHMVKPRMVYISNATEIGTIYTKSELEALYACCKRNDLLLFLDGARLGTALCSKYSDLSLEGLANLTDLFTLGATKNGALLGEGIIINNPLLMDGFDIQIKQRGALLAKGKLLGIQFFELFKNDLYFELATHANAMAEKISQGFVGLGHKLLDDTQSNQVFLILPNELIAQLEHSFSFYTWAPHDEHHSVVRMVTSWATPEAKVDSLIALCYSITNRG